MVTPRPVKRDETYLNVKLAELRRDIEELRLASITGFDGTTVTTTNWLVQSGSVPVEDWAIEESPIAIPEWATEAIVMATANIRVVNTTGSSDTALMHPFISTTLVGGTHPSDMAAVLTAGATGSIGNSYQRHFTDLTPDTDPNILVSVIVGSVTADWSAHASNTAILSAVAIFKA